MAYPLLLAPLLVLRFALQLAASILGFALFLAGVVFLAASWRAGSIIPSDVLTVPVLVFLAAWFIDMALGRCVCLFDAWWFRPVQSDEDREREVVKAMMGFKKVPRPQP